MAEKEMYDYLSVVSPDYADVTLTINPQAQLIEKMVKNQKIHLFDDGSERGISLDNDVIFEVTIGWPTGISKSNAGTIMDLFCDSAKANGFVRSFKWTHPEDGHTYVVKFRSALERRWVAGISIAGYHKVDTIQLKVIGRIADA